MVHWKTKINITVDGGDDRVYSTHDIIGGRVTLEHRNDVILADLTLTLEGASATQVANTSNTGPASGRLIGRHHFLKLQHPFNASTCSGMSMEDGRNQVQIPFTFVVPDKILSGACNHKTQNEDVKSAHLLLPPTLEDDHYAKGVHVARISYEIRVRCHLMVISTGATQIESRSVGIHIAPTREERPLLDLQDHEYGFCLRRSLPVRSAFRKVLGELTVETTQPTCLRLGTPNVQEEGISTTLNLSFIPTKQEEQPPHITAIATKLMEYTFCGASPFEELPQPNKAYDKMPLHTGYIEDFALAARKLNNLQWVTHAGDSSTSMRNAQSDNAPPPSNGFKYYTTSILVPVAIPEVPSSKGLKKFAPSFHSCLVSRVHAIEYAVHVKANPLIVLTTPVQIVAMGTRERPTSPTLPSATLIEIDRVFSIEDNDEAPDYEEFPSVPATQSSDAARRPSQADELPNYATDANLTVGQTQRASANRHSVSTVYEVPEQEWQVSPTLPSKIQTYRG